LYDRSKDLRDENPVRVEKMLSLYPFIFRRRLSSFFNLDDKTLKPARRFSRAYWKEINV
jgi:hypothetical protein